MVPFIYLFQLFLCIAQAAELSDSTLPQLMQTISLLMCSHDLIPHLLLQVLFLLRNITLLFLGLLQPEGVEMLLVKLDRTTSHLYKALQVTKNYSWILTVPVNLWGSAQPSEDYPNLSSSWLCGFYWLCSGPEQTSSLQLPSPPTQWAPGPSCNYEDLWFSEKMISYGGCIINES